MLLLRRGPSEEPQGVSTAETPDPASTVEDAPAQGAQPTSDAALEAVGQPAPGEPIPGDASAVEWTVISGKVEHSLARTFQREADEDGDALTSVFSRLFVWDLDMRRDLLAGDTIAVVWRKGPDGLPEIAAAALHSSKLGRTLTTYRWQAPGDPFPSYWHLDGTEVPLRLKDGPIAQYEQVTSLLKDRPTHKGMDFKTPVGTEVTAPRAGTVTRANWNWKANGNCIEIRYDDGVIAKFLHLNENRVKQGDRVRVGQVIALTGNTGHSTAPHLHYQLDRGDKTIDPLEYHGTVRRSLDADQAAALRRDVAAFEKMLDDTAGR
ncbi:MAG: M23 family metallopeptidase [Myxococcales bacterium]|nr:MAG: M23 family metallopeptidase [Myxococcales bacterium]